MLVTVKKNYVNGPRGDVTMLDRALIKPTGIPTGGWSSSVVRNGHAVNLKGSSPRLVYERLLNLCRENNVSYTSDQLWATLNIDWLGRTPEQHRLVSVESLMEAINTDEIGGIDTSWIKPLVDIIGYYLATRRDSGLSQGLYSLYSEACRVGDPVSSPSTSHPAVWVTLLEIRTDLWQKPVHSIDEARTWFLGIYQKLRPLADLKDLEEHELRNKYRWTH